MIISPYIVIALALAAVTNEIGAQLTDECFMDFLSDVMGPYTDWVEVKGYEPFKESPFIVNLTQYDNETQTAIMGEIRNQVLVGHSNRLSWGTKANFMARNFSVNYHLRDFYIFGEYEVRGTTKHSKYTLYPVYGKGHFSLHDDSTYAYLTVTGFDINSHGFIDISQAHVSGFEKEVVQLLRKRYEEQFLSWFPVPNLMRQFLETAFSILPVRSINQTFCK